MKYFKIILLTIFAFCGIDNSFASGSNILFVSHCEEMYCINIYNTEDHSKSEIVREAEPISNLVFDIKGNSIYYLNDGKIKNYHLNTGQTETLPYREVTSFIIDENILVISIYSFEREGELGLFKLKMDDAMVDTLLYSKYMDSQIVGITSNNMKYFILTEFMPSSFYYSIGKIENENSGSNFITVHDAENIFSPNIINNSIIALKGHPDLYFEEIISIDISTWSENVIHSCNDDGVYKPANYPGLKKIVSKNLKENITFIGVEAEIKCDYPQEFYNYDIKNQEKTGIYLMKTDGSSKTLILSDENIIGINYYSPDDTKLTYLVMKDEHINLKVLELTTGQTSIIDKNIYIDIFNGSRDNGIWISQ